MRGFFGILAGLLLVGVIFLSLIVGGSFMAQQNGGQSISSIPVINVSANDLTTQLSKEYQTANNTNDVMTKSPISITNYAFVIDAVGGIWTTLKVIPAATYNIIATFVGQALLGNTLSTIFLGVIGSILLIAIFLFAWKMLRTGDPQ